MGEETSGFSRGLRASKLIQDASAFNVRPGDRCSLTSISIQDGVELQLWEASFATPLQIDILEDSERIHFTYVMQGGAQIEMASRRYGNGLEASSGTGVLHACPGEKGRFRQVGNYSSVVVMVRPDVFSGWSETAAAQVQDAVTRGQCLIGGVNGAELQRQARRLHRMLRLASSDSGAPQDTCGHLRLQIHGLSFVAEFLDRVNLGQERRLPLSREDRYRLERARELLLADLAKAPTLAELAAASGLGMVKLKRGFQVMFGTSVYGLFMQERMHEARRRLLLGGVSVTAVATDLGYTNISHFAAAFRKQFDVAPASIRNGAGGYLNDCQTVGSQHRSWSAPH